MAQVFDDWSADTVGAPPSSARWTPFGFAGSAGLWTGNVVDLGGGARAVQFADAGWGNRHVGYSSVAIGTYAGSQVQIRARVRLRATQTSLRGLLYAYWNGSNGYVPGPNGATNFTLFDGNGFAPDGVNGTNTAAFTMTTDVWYWWLWDRQSTAVQRLRVWADGGSEPGTWLITSDADTGYTSGVCGFGAFPGGNPAFEVSQIGIGTDGDAAPSSGGPPATNYHPGTRRRRPTLFRRAA